MPPPDRDRTTRTSSTLTGVASRFGAFVAERHPFALDEALDAFEAGVAEASPCD